MTIIVYASAYTSGTYIPNNLAFLSCQNNVPHIFLWYDEMEDGIFREIVYF